MNLYIVEVDGPPITFGLLGRTFYGPFIVRDLLNVEWFHSGRTQGGSPLPIELGTSRLVSIVPRPTRHSCLSGDGRSTTD